MRVAFVDFRIVWSISGQCPGQASFTVRSALSRRFNGTENWMNNTKNYSYVRPRRGLIYGSWCSVLYSGRVLWSWSERISSRGPRGPDVSAELVRQAVQLTDDIHDAWRRSLALTAIANLLPFLGPEWIDQALLPWRST
jgi:hypothetical protein